MSKQKQIILVDCGEELAEQFSQQAEGYQIVTGTGDDVAFNLNLRYARSGERAQPNIAWIIIGREATDEGIAEVANAVGILNKAGGKGNEMNLTILADEESKSRLMEQYSWIRAEDFMVRKSWGPAAGKELFVSRRREI